MVALVLALTACTGAPQPGPDPSGSGVATPSAAGASPSQAVTSPAAVPPAIPDGTYVQAAPVTRAEAVAHGLRGADVRENLGRFTLELADGAFLLSQDAPRPVEFPLIVGAYAWSPAGLVLTPSTFRGQVWTLRVRRAGPRVRFRVVAATSSFVAPARVRAGVATIFSTHVWMRRG